MILIWSGMLKKSLKCLQIAANGLTPSHKGNNIFSMAILWNYWYTYEKGQNWCSLCMLSKIKPVFSILMRRLKGMKRALSKLSIPACYAHHEHIKRCLLEQTVNDVELGSFTLFIFRTKAKQSMTPSWTSTAVKQVMKQEKQARFLFDLVRSRDKFPCVQSLEMALLFCGAGNYVSKTNLYHNTYIHLWVLIFHR